MAHEPEPTVEELASKALKAGAIDEEFANELRECADLQDALGMFYSLALTNGENPDALLREWGITI